jgi:hypothetical protein
LGHGWLIHIQGICKLKGVSSKQLRKTKKKTIKFWLGAVHSAPLRKRQGLCCTNGTLSRHLRHIRVPGRPSSLLFPIRKTGLRLSDRSLSIPVPSGQLRPTFYTRYKRKSLIINASFTVFLFLLLLLLLQDPVPTAKCCL